MLFQRALAAAKRIKTDPRLSSTPLSVATLVANEVFRFKKGDGGVKNVMVIGMSGKMGTTITKNILSKPGIRVTGTYRSHKPDFAMEIKNDRVRLVEYQDRYRHMGEMDIVVSATFRPPLHGDRPGAGDGLWERTGADACSWMWRSPWTWTRKSGRSLGLTLYNIDYFETLSKSNTEIKLKELDRARVMMEEDLDAAVRGDDVPPLHPADGGAAPSV